MTILRANRRDHTTEPPLTAAEWRQVHAMQRMMRAEVEAGEGE